MMKQFYNEIFKPEYKDWQGMTKGDKSKLNDFIYKSIEKAFPDLELAISD